VAEDWQSWSRGLDGIGSWFLFRDIILYDETGKKEKARLKM
jgi:hypothetical protein